MRIGRWACYRGYSGMSRGGPLQSRPGGQRQLVSAAVSHSIVPNRLRSVDVRESVFSGKLA
jgi:hypothetical protein